VKVTPEENVTSMLDNSDEIPQKKRGRPVSSCKIEDYVINYLAYLMMQLFGNGISSIETMLGMLGIAITSGNHTSWATVGNRLGVAQQSVADVVQKMNLENEIKAMEQCGVKQIDDKGIMKWPLTCKCDMGWQKHKNYNSPSGHGFLVGGYTNKVIKWICYSKGCRYCVNAWKKQGITRAEATKDKPMGELTNITTSHRCPRNYNGTAKSMEASGAVSMITALYNDGKDLLSTLVGDDDSTTF